MNRMCIDGWSEEHFLLPLPCDVVKNIVKITRWNFKQRGIVVDIVGYSYPPEKFTILSRVPIAIQSPLCIFLGCTLSIEGVMIQRMILYLHSRM